ncbi:collagen-binding domain-containing protein, partial [Acinetobacter baumannii]
MVFALGAGWVCGAAMAVPTIDFGVANGYSGFFVGDVSGAADVEGRLAVGGNLTRGFDVGYRNPYNAAGPTLV